MVLDFEQRIIARIHLGHPTRHWHPKIATYIYGVKHGSHLIDLIKTRAQLIKAQEFLEKVRRCGRNILFVGTQNSAIDIVRESARATEGFFVNERWLGGILTNWTTLRVSLLQFYQLEREHAQGTWTLLQKKEIAFLVKRFERLNRYLGGLNGIQSLPSVVILIGQTFELSAVIECKKLNIPIVCALDTNCDPTLVEIGVPINDDSKERISLFLNTILPSIQKGYNSFRKNTTPKNLN
jgi:small subunit ribosomal protein S2